MGYLSLYRKWRPQRFADVVGQQHAVRTLVNALNQGRIGHAYLFAGPRGTGKTTLARLLAKGLNCRQGPTGEPCDQCEVCRRIREGTSLDVLEIDGASNRGIDEIRELRENVRFAPAEGRYKVYIIDEVHMLTNEAFNALLKVLEEPPAHTVFVFATTEAHKVPATILSRCQRFDFKRLSVAEIAGRLAQVAEEEGVACAPEALALIARYAEGGMRDALSILDQCFAYAEGQVTPEVVVEVLGSAPRTTLLAMADALEAGDLVAALRLVQELYDEGRDLRQFVRDLVRYYRDLMVLKASGQPDLASVAGADRDEAMARAERLPLEEIVRVLDLLAQLEGELRWAPQGRLALEMTLMKAAWPRQLAAAAEVTASALASASPPPARPATRAREEPSPAASPAVPSSSTEEVGAAAPAASTGQGETPPAASPSAPTASADPSQAPSAEPSPAAEPPAPAQPRAAAAEAPAVSPEVPAGGPDLLQRVQEAWERFLNTLREKGFGQYEVYLREGRPAAVRGNRLLVGFPPERMFHQLNADLNKPRQADQLLSRLVGAELILETCTEPVPGDPVPGAEGPPSGGGTAGGVSPAGGSPAPGDGRSASTGGGRSGVAAGRDGAGREAAGRRVGTVGQAGGAGARVPPGGPDPNGAARAGKEGAAASPEARPAGASDPVVAGEEDPLVREALSLFGGRIVQIMEAPDEA